MVFRGCYVLGITSTATDHIIRSYLGVIICLNASSGAARVGFASKAERKDARLVGVLVDLKIEFLVWLEAICFSITSAKNLPAGPVGRQSDLSMIRSHGHPLLLPYQLLPEPEYRVRINH